MPSRNRKKRCKQRAEYLQKREDILSQRTRLKPESATRPTLKRRRPLYATPTRPTQKRRRPLYATPTRPTLKRRRPLYATPTTQMLYLSVLLKGSDIKRASRRTVLLKGSDIKRASRRTVLLKGGYTGAIQLPLRQLEGVGIGRVVELPLPPKGML